MARFVAISRERHAGKAWRRITDYSFAAKSPTVPLVGAEFPKAALSFPIAFVEQDGGFMPVGVMALVPDQNMFVGPSGEWLGLYVPAVLRSHPFRLAASPNGGPPVLCIDEDADTVVDAGGPGAPFFDPDGAPSAALKDILRFLTQIDANRVATARAVAALAAAGVIEPWSIKVAAADGEKAIAGLYAVQERQLNTIAPDTFLDLRGAGALPIAYTQCLSMMQLSVFDRLASQRTQLETARAHRNKELSRSFTVPAEEEMVEFSWGNLP